MPLLFWYLRRISGCCERTIACVIILLPPLLLSANTAIVSLLCTSVCRLCRDAARDEKNWNIHSYIQPVTHLEETGQFEHNNPYGPFKWSQRLKAAFSSSGGNLWVSSKRLCIYNWIRTTRSDCWRCHSKPEKYHCGVNKVGPRSY